MNIKAIFSLLVLGCLCTQVYAQQYSEKQLQEMFNRAVVKSQQSQNMNIENVDLYNQYIFQINQRTYGAYQHIKLNLPDYRSNDQLTEAQKNSIRNYEERAKIMQMAFEGK